MTQAENFSRPNKGILKWSKLSRSASLQSKKTCFKEEYTNSGVEHLSKTFNFGCSLDVPEWSCTSKDSSSSSKLCGPNDGMYEETIAEEEDVLQQNPEFIERRKSFEMKANVDNFQGIVDLRAVLAHRIPDLEPEDDEEEKPKVKLEQTSPDQPNTAQNLIGNSNSKSDSYLQQSLDVEMTNN